jgi:16S rRNA (uracil1498-N3)-methyltransferase
MKHIPRFYLETDLVEGKEVFLSPNQMRHAGNVLRLIAGDIVRVFNPQCGEWNCEISDIKKRSLKCVSLLKKAKEEKNGSVIACSLINPKRFDFFLEKATELGAGEIIPVVSRYSQYKSLNLEKSKQKIIQACEQSRRISIPVLRGIMAIEDFFQKYSDHKILVGDERFSGSKLEDILEEKSIFLVGPEGGFSDDECNLFDTKKNIYRFSFGTNILRSETAAIAFAAIWGHKFL